MNAPMGKVLVIASGADQPETLRAAYEYATAQGAGLSVLVCVEPPREIDRLSRSTGQKAQAMLDHFVAERRDAATAALEEALPPGAATLYVAVGKPFYEITRHVVRHGVGLVVKSAEPLPGAGALLFSSTDQHLVRKCPCAVWLRQPGAAHPPLTILAAVDVDDWDAGEPQTLDALNQAVLDTARRLAAGTRATVHALHAWDDPGEGLVWAFASGPDPRAAARAYLQDIENARAASLDRLLAEHAPAVELGGPKVVPLLVRGDTRRVIAEQCQALQADILVMGTVARTGLSGILIGNTAEDILNTATCSVMTVKPAGFQTPLHFTDTF